MNKQTEKKYSRSHIGEVGTTKELLGAYTCKIIDGGSTKGHCTIRIGKVTKEVPYVRICSGAIKYEYHPSVFNIGFLGEGSNTMESKGVVTKASQSAWTGNHQIYLGMFKEKEEAANAYQKQRAIYAEEWKQDMAGMLPVQALEAI